VCEWFTAGNWNIYPGGISGSSESTITELAVGTHKFTVSNDTGCTSGIIDVNIEAARTNIWNGCMVRWNTDDYR
jgi:hypothetical protein